MAIEMTLVCDKCATIIDAGKSASQVLQLASKEGTAARVRVGRRAYDVCSACLREYSNVNALKESIRKGSLFFKRDR